MAARKRKMMKVPKKSHEAAIKFLSKANKRDAENFIKVTRAVQKAVNKDRGKR